MRTCAPLVLLGLCPKLKYPPLCGGIFIVTRKRQTAAFEWLAVKDTSAKTKPLISKENAQNRPETIQRETVLGVSAFREQIGN